MFRAQTTRAKRDADFRDHWTKIVRGEDESVEALIATLRCQAALAFPDEDPFDEVESLRVLGTLNPGKAGGQDAVLAEYLAVLCGRQKQVLVCLLQEVLRGTSLVPASWRAACVSLIPKVAAAALPIEFRPIIVLPVLMKCAMRIWITAAREFLQLQRRSSHGFRASFQAAEVQLGLRALITKRSEWGLRTRVCKLDIKKAYDTASWSAIKVFPQVLRSAYWRLHLDRTLQFRSGDGTVVFAATPRRGMPQGSPESPMLYASLMESLIETAEARLLVSDRPAGVKILLGEAHADQVEASRTKAAFGPEHAAYLNFADDTYVVGEDSADLSYATSVLAQELARAEQHLHPSKCEVLRPLDDDDEGKVSIWPESAVERYIRTGWSGPVDTPVMKSVTSLLVLGSQISLDPHQEAALNHRVSCAWVAWHAIRPQVLARSVPLRLRSSLLRSVVGACLMWGLESINMPKANRRRLGAIQRRMVATMLRLFRRPTENAEAFFRRRARVTTAMVSKHFSCSWSVLQRYKLSCFLGHVARQEPRIHIASHILRWRSLQW